MKRLNMLFLLFLMLTGAAHAQDEQKSRPGRFMLTGGLFMPQMNTELTLRHGDGTFQTHLDGEEDLGLADNTNAIRLDALLHLSPRWAMTASWYKLNRSSHLDLSRQIEFQDTTYEFGAALNTKMNTTFTSASFRYSILHKDKIDAGLSLGVRWASIDASGEVSSDGFTVSESYKGGAPAPLPGLFVSTHLLPSLMLNYNLEYFKLSVQGVEGMIREHKITMGWFPVRNIGLGLSWSDIDYRADNIPFREDFHGDVKHELSGFTYFVAVRF